MSRRSALVAAACAAGFAAVAALVAAGSLTGLDQWAVDHAMPGLHGGARKPTLLEALVPLLHADLDSPLHAAADLVTLPAQSVLSLLVVAACCVGARRLDWLAALVAGDAVEVLCKTVLAKPPLSRGAFHIVAFDTSFPSGHALRTVVVAAALAAVWPRARPLLAAWAVASVVLLELDGHHVPSDLAGGLLLAGAALALARHSS